MIWIKILLAALVVGIIAYFLTGAHDRLKTVRESSGRIAKVLRGRGHTLLPDLLDKVRDKERRDYLPAIEGVLDRLDTDSEIVGELNRITETEIRNMWGDAAGREAFLQMFQRATGVTLPENLLAQLKIQLAHKPSEKEAPLSVGNAAVRSDHYTEVVQDPANGKTRHGVSGKVVSSVIQDIPAPEAPAQPANPANSVTHS